MPILMPAPAPRTSTTREPLEAETWSRLLAHARLVAAAVLRKPLSHPDVEDRAQDAMVSFLSSGLPRYDPSLGTPEALLGVIVRNRALTQLRDRSTHARLGEQLAAESSTTTSAPQRRVDARADLGRILARLCPGHVEALVRIDLVGEPIAEAAQRLGKTYQAMNGQVGHARAAARRVALELAAA